MSKVFIGGSRRIAKLDTEVQRRIDRMIERRLPIVVGDANGADAAVQYYLRTKDYELVEVFCSGDSCRNNRGGWPTRTVATPSGNRKDFGFYAAKDRAMAEEATVGLMLWDGESLGTVMNVLRLVERQKKVVVYIAPERRFVDVKTDGDWEAFLASCAAPLKERVAKESLAEREIEDGASRARFVAAVQEGLADLHAGRVVSDEELGRRLEREPAPRQDLEVLRSLPSGTRTKEDIDTQIAEERDSWDER